MNVRTRREKKGEGHITKYELNIVPVHNYCSLIILIIMLNYSQKILLIRLTGFS